jgi:hypothetical protein
MAESTPPTQPKRGYYWLRVATEAWARVRRHLSIPTALGLAALLTGPWLTAGIVVWLSDPAKPWDTYQWAVGANGAELIIAVSAFALLFFVVPSGLDAEARRRIDQQAAELIKRDQEVAVLKTDLEKAKLPIGTIDLGPGHAVLIGEHDPETKLRFMERFEPLVYSGRTPTRANRTDVRTSTVGALTGAQQAGPLPVDQLPAPLVDQPPAPSGS